MEGNIHAWLLLSTIPIGAVLCWFYKGMPARRWHFALRILAASVVVVAVWMGSAGMFQCLCGPGNNPTIQGWLPGIMAAVATVVIRNWRPRLATIALMLAMGYGLSWQFHKLVLPEDRTNQFYTGADMFEENPPEAKFWHTHVTGLFRLMPPLPKESELHRAVRDNDLEKVRAMIAAGIPLDERAREGGYMALHVAAGRGSLEIAKALLDAGAKVDSKDFTAETPLHKAGSAEVAALLLSRNANVNARSTNGATPLYQAASKGHKAIVELLIAKGANLELKEHDRMTPLYVAIRNDRKEVAEYLIEKGASIQNGELGAAASFSRKEIAVRLISRGADINAMHGGRYPLSLASQKGDLEMVQLLVEHGADIRAKDISTALEAAASDQVRQYLISKGAQ